MFCTQVQLILVCYRWPWTLGQTLSVLRRVWRTSDRWVKIFIEVKKFNIQRNHSFNLLFQLKNTQVCFCLLKLLFVYPNTERNLNCNQQNLLLPFLEKKTNMFHCKQRFIKQVIVHTNCMNSVFYFHSNVQIEFFFIKVQTKVSKHTSKYNVSSDVRCCIPNNGGICSSRYYLPCGKWREIARVLRTFFQQSPVPLTETAEPCLNKCPP